MDTNINNYSTKEILQLIKLSENECSLLCHHRYISYRVDIVDYLAASTAIIAPASVYGVITQL